MGKEKVHEGHCIKRYEGGTYFNKQMHYKIMYKNSSVLRTILAFTTLLCIYSHQCPIQT